MSVPKLRFPEFWDAGDWEEKKLGDIAEKISDGIHSTPNYNESGLYYFVNGNNLVDDKIVINESTKRIDEIEYLKYKTELSSQTILISINGTIGNLAFFNGEKVVLGKSACYINLKPNENKYFVFNLLKTSNIQKYFEKELTGSTIKNLSLASIKNAKTFFPIPSEQQKIADCLSSIGDRITAETQKLHTLKAHKKGLMQQLFPAESEILPKFRFPEFTSDWFHDVLSHHIKLISGMHLSPDEYDNSETEDKIPYFTGPSDFTNNMGEVSKWTLRNNKNFAVKGDTLLTVKGSGIGQLMFLELIEVAMGRQLMAVSANPDTGKFIFYCLDMKKQYFEALGSGNMIPGITRTDILSTKIFFPKNNKEQKKIADCLSSLDELIAAQTQAIAALKLHKKGLMQQLFPSIEEVKE